MVYIGSHGDEGAKNSDLILPGSAYTEQDGYFTNLEGKIQKAYKASYPTELAKEDWLIINEISNITRSKYLFKDKNELIDNMFNYLNQTRKEEFILTESSFENEKILVDDMDYYFSNIIAKNSKTMSECRSLRSNLKNRNRRIIMDSLYILFNEVYKILFLLIPVLVTVAMIVWLDRRVWAFVQRRCPNVGPFGLLQSLADALKYIFKEIIVPASSNKVIFILAPIITMTLALVAWAVIPFSENLVIADINVGILYLFAVSSWVCMG